MHTHDSAPSPPTHPIILASTSEAILPIAPQTELEMEQGLLDLVQQAAQSPDSQQIQTWAEHLYWVNYVQRCSRLLFAVLEPTTLALLYANDHFCHLLGIDRVNDSRRPVQERCVATLMQRLLSEESCATLNLLYRRHLLHLVLRDFYQVDTGSCRMLDAPVMVSFRLPHSRETRYIEFWLRSEHLRITRINPQVDEFADLHLPQLMPGELAAQLADPEQMRYLETRLNLDNYRVSGQLLLEGLDITVRETIRRITQLLIDRDSILRPHKFRQVNRQMRSLFRAQNTVILSVDHDQIRLFMGSVGPDLDTSAYPLDYIQDTHFMQAIQSNRVIAVTDLARDCHTDCSRQLLDMGVRSLLLIPLLSPLKAPSPHSPYSQVIGLVSLVSDRPNNFDGLDCLHAEQLISPFTAALTSAQRQLVQQRFIANIHPAVEWRFLEEAERRSLGLPAEPIIFTDVYPLYGISDIRGSSQERNRAIQADLLEQFQLGLKVVEAAGAAQSSALAEQICLDLLEHIERLQHQITVNAEVTELRYLREHLEIYFEHFAQTGEAAAAAIAAYRLACDNEHHCVYQARAHYDALIGTINTLLRETWEQWQVRMQQISPHYCDIETTDGIDHMLYVGRAIDPKFGDFQLRSLRYEQLRAICDCARSALTLQARCQSQLQVTHLVLVQDATVDIFHDESTEKLFDVRGTRDTRYEIVKKRIDKAIDQETQDRITQPGMLTLVYSTGEEWEHYHVYLRYLMREGWIDTPIEQGTVEPLQGVTGLKFARVRVLPDPCLTPAEIEVLQIQGAADKLADY